MVTLSGYSWDIWLDSDLGRCWTDCKSDETKSGDKQDTRASNVCRLKVVFWPGANLPDQLAAVVGLSSEMGQVLDIQKGILPRASSSMTWVTD
jgi:hypothetical protein